MQAMEGELPALAPALLKRAADASGAFLSAYIYASCVYVCGVVFDVLCSHTPPRSTPIHTGDAATAALEALVTHAPDPNKVAAAFLPLVSHRQPAQRARALGVLVRCCQAAAAGWGGAGGWPLGKEATERVTAAARLRTVG